MKYTHIHYATLVYEDIVRELDVTVYNDYVDPKCYEGCELDLISKAECF